MRILHSPDGSRIQALLRSAERRRLLVLAAEQSALSLALVLAGFILMLVLGTQILDWYWLALLAAMGLALLAVRVRSRPLAPYRLAQIIDRRLKLSDSLSTAWFLLAQDRGHEPIARLQIQRAGELARSVQTARAFPFSGGRPWAFAAALGALAFGLFAVRYLVTRSLNLEHALVPIHLGTGPEAGEEPLSAHNLKSAIASSRDSEPAVTKAAHAAATRYEKPGTSAPQDASAANRASAAAGDGKPIENGHSQPGSTGTTQAGRSDSQSAATGSQLAPNGDERSEQKSAGAMTQAPAAEPNSSSLLDNMKDAFSSLLSKMRPSSGPQTPREGERSSDQSHSTNQAALGRNPRDSQTGAHPDQSTQQEKTAGDAQGQAADKSHAAQTRNSSDSAARNGSDNRSGVGRQDGNKDLTEAQQLQAMGKLAEIIGKRSADLTGDITVETPSGKQQLKTEYSQRMGHHSDLGGEINRDEIPLMYQQYIRDYMEAVRKEQRPQ